MIEVFGSLPNGERVERIGLHHGRLSAAILTHGASLQSLSIAPHSHSLVLGFPDLQAYLDNPYFGAMVGRVANRIGGGIFELDGRTIRLDRNENGHQTLHGGSRSIAFRNWAIADYSQNHVTMLIIDRPEYTGFPGNCEISVTYRLQEDALVVQTQAVSDETTVCNIAHHSYFNLTGGPDILGHELQISADRYLPTDPARIPVGEVAEVAGTPFDFRQPAPITRDAAAVIDHNYCLNKAASTACRLHSPQSGITMTIETTQPGLQVFMANGITTRHPGHDGLPYRAHCGIALEPQHWPDAPNHPHFPDITLRPGEEYAQRSAFRFRP